MLEKCGSTFTANCDFCSYDEDTDEDEFISAVERMKKLGWKIFKQGGEWFHKCPSCLASDVEDDFENVE